MKIIGIEKITASVTLQHLLHNSNVNQYQWPKFEKRCYQVFSIYALMKMNIEQPVFEVELAPNRLFSVIVLALWLKSKSF